MENLNHLGMPFRYALILLVSLFWGAVGVSAQTLHGKVVDARTQEPIIGAVVSIKGFKGNVSGAVTDLNGNFSLEVKNTPVTIVASYTGYNNEEVEIYEVTDDKIQIDLKENLNGLNEVVVIGYGSVSRKALTGAISSIDAGALQRTPIISVDQGLAGKAAGVQVVQSSGMPGAIASITVRGASSLQGGNEPLYIIDGFPIYSGTGFGETGGKAQLSGLSTLNPSDIESVEILKDAASTAIYGARAANGVVLVTTKNGKKGQDVISFNTYWGWSNVAKKLDVMKAQEYADLVNEARTNDGLEPYYSENDLEKISKLGNGTDWQNEIFRTGISQSYQLEFSGGDEKSQYSISGNYTDQSGNIINTNLKRYTGLVNLTRKLRKNFEIGLHATGSYMINQMVPTDVGSNGGVVCAAVEMNPILSVYNDETTHTYTELNIPGEQIANPVATANEEKIINKTSRVIANIYGKWEIIPNLELKVSGGADIFYNKSYNYIPSTIYESGGTATATIGVTKTVNWLNENTLTWRHSFNKYHDVTLLGGFTLQQNNMDYVSASSSNFVTDKLTYNSLQSGSVYNEPTSSAEQWNLLSYLARADYSYKQKYFASLTTRVDGSSRFGANNKYGFFPSVSGAWVISEEPWFQSLKNTLSNLKARASYGFTGNTEIGVYQSLATLGTYNYIIGGSQVIGLAPDIIPNPDLKWEKTGQFDFGLDVDLFKDRLHLTLDYYYKKTTNMLYSVSVPYTTGYETMLENIGNMENNGWEFSISNDNIRTKVFDWTTNFNISFSKNKVLYLGGNSYKELPESDSGLKTGSVRRLMVGEPIGLFYGYVFDGIFQNEEETKEQTSSISPIGVGLPRYKDLNGDGKVDPNDRTILGDSNPDFFGGLTNTFSYKNFQLNIFFQYSYGNDIFNMLGMELSNPTGNQNIFAKYVDRWTDTNPSPTLQKATTNRALIVSDRFIEDGSYLKLKSLTLSYQFSLKKSSFVKYLNLYFTTTNLITWTNYSGFDPEVSYRGSSTLESGEDFGGYPQSRSYTFGVKLNF